MDIKEIFTKGDRETILSRMDQIHTITMYCPIEDEGVMYFRDVLNTMVEKYKINDMLWKNVPAIDSLNVFINVAKKCVSNKIEMGVVSIIVASLKAFNRLKYINFEFTDDKKISDAYIEMVTSGKRTISTKIYKLDVMEMNLTDMFSQDMIDMFNRVLVFDDIIPNSYLDRKYVIDFSFDEYISFMDMFLGHNGPSLNMMDKNICDYFRTFPQTINEHKPHIKIVTNYSEM